MICFFCRLDTGLNEIRCSNCKTIEHGVSMHITGKGFANKENYIRNMQMGHMNELKKEAEKMGVNTY